MFLARERSDQRPHWLRPYIQVIQPPVRLDLELKRLAANDFCLALTNTVTAPTPISTVVTRTTTTILL